MGNKSIVVRPPIWEGVYDRFPPVPFGATFSQSRWTDGQQNLVEGVATGREKRAGGMLLREILAGWMAAQDGEVKVLDFGGGLGIEYLMLASSIMPLHRLTFDVVESIGICRIGRKLFRQTPNIHFRTRLPVPPATYQVFHAANSLHYVGNWQHFVGNIAKLRPSVIVLAGVTAGSIPTFATVQNYYGAKIPVWFWNENDLATEFAKHGFQLIMKTEAEARYFSRVRNLPMDNFPRSHRLRRKCNLIFRRTPSNGKTRSIGEDRDGP